MSEVRRQSWGELARTSEEPVEELRRWLDLGLLHIDANGEPDDGAAARVRLIQFARRRGIEVEQVAAAVADQPDLLGFFEEEVQTRSGRMRSFDEAIAETGVDPELAARVRHTAGLDDEEGLYDDDVAALRSMALAVQAGMPEAALLQLVRVYADALGRVAEAEVRLFHLYVHEQFRAQGLRGAALLSATNEVGEPLRGLVDPTVAYFHGKAWERASLEDLLLHLTEDVTPPGVVPGQIRSTVLFIDLASFTPMTMAMGDAAAAQVVGRFSDLIRSCAAGHGGRIVKQIGDAFMVVFAEAASAIGCGLDVEAAVADEPQFPSVHVGAHTGELLYREGDYLGHTVNVAARIASEAGPHEMLISAALREAAGQPDAVAFTSLGVRRLKGIAEPLALFAAHRGQPPAQRLRDPVCGMEIRPGHEHARLVWEGRELAFCSTECLQRFTADPQVHGIP